MSTELNLERVRQNAKKATTEDLLDRVTVYREEMEAAAVAIIEAELIDRGVTAEDVQARLNAGRTALRRNDGTVIKCAFCHKPAVRQGWGWHRLFGRIPVFPRALAWCEEHAPRQ